MFAVNGLELFFQRLDTLDMPRALATCASFGTTLGTALGAPREAFGGLTGGGRRK